MIEELTISKDYHDITTAIARLRQGGMIIVTDDNERENEGDLIMAASLATPEAIAFIIRYTSGILCAPMPASIAARLELPLMISDNNAPLQTAFTISVDCRHELNTGISARERCTTFRFLSDVESDKTDFVRPGHVFPLIADKDGVLGRGGHTEAAVDLMRLAGLPPVAVIAELVNDDGSVKRAAAINEFSRGHNLPVLAIAEIIKYRQNKHKI